MDTNQRPDDLIRFWPDGYTEEKIDVLLTWVYTSSDQGIPSTAALLDGSAVRRRDQRIKRRLARVTRLVPAPDDPRSEAA